MSDQLIFGSESGETKILDLDSVNSGASPLVLQDGKEIEIPIKDLSSFINDKILKQNSKIGELATELTCEFYLLRDRIPELKTAELDIKFKVPADYSIEIKSMLSNNP